MDEQQDGEWHTRAACHPTNPNQYDPNEWSPRDWFSSDPVRENRARQRCRTDCPVRAHCEMLFHTLSALEQDSGVWYGTSPMDRRRTARARRNSRTTQLLSLDANRPKIAQRDAESC